MLQSKHNTRLEENEMIRWGIAGPGIIAEKFARAVKNVPDAELYAVASRDADRGNAFAKKHGIENIFLGYEAMAKDPLIDAVYVSTPHPFHLPVARLFLENGKSVLCEKPLTVNAEQARELASVARKNGVFLMEAMWSRFLPAVKKAVSLAKSGEIGEIRSISADFCYPLGKGEDDKLLLDYMAGGSLLDVGSYCLHFADMLLGRHPDKIFATGRVKDGIDMSADILLSYPSGASARLSSAMDHSKESSGYIYGSEGSIFMPNFYKAREFYLRKGDEVRHISLAPIGEGFEEEIIEVGKCITNGKTESDTLPLSVSIEILELADTIRKAIGVIYPFENI